MFLFRVDIDSASGLLRGLPNILSILSRLDMQGTFFPIMGWEGDFISTIRHRLLRSGRQIPGRTSGTSFGLGPVRYLEHLRCMLFPVKIPGLRPSVLREIEASDHCLGVHGYVHVRWHFPTHGELEEEFELMTSAYRELVGKKPMAIATPLGYDDPKVRELVARHRFLSLSGLGGTAATLQEVNGKGSPFVDIPVNIDTIESMRTSGASRTSTYDILTDQILRAEEKHGLSSFYVHPRYEGSHETELLGKILRFVNDNGIEAGTHVRFAEAFAGGSVRP